LSRGRGRLRQAFLLAALGVTGLLAARVAFFRPLPVAGEAPSDGYARVPAVFHVHTTLSDGGGTPEQVIRAAREAGVRVLGITDHNHLDAKRLEGYHDGVLVLVGAELSTPSGHVLGLGLDRDPPFRFAGDALDALDDVRTLGGQAFAAHPFSERADLRFNRFDLPGAWGLELLNGDSDARRAGPRLLLTAFSYRLNPGYALLAGTAPIDAALARWDALLAERDVVGLAGADAHGRLSITRSRSLAFPSYEALLRQARNHLLLRAPLSGDLARDRAAVLEALGAGRLYIGLDALAPADSFSFTVSGGGSSATMGGQLEPTGSPRARAGGRVPEGARLVLRRDGEVVGEGRSRMDLPLSGPGVYRVEAWLPGWRVPWVVTNPVYVFDAATREARRLRAAWPGPPPPPRESAPLSFAVAPPFSTEHDPSSAMDESAMERKTGPGGVDAWRLGFRLASPGPGQFTWCALVNREARDLSGWEGLRFRLRADGEYRMWVQLRDVNPASADEGLEWWMASARSSGDWSEVQIPFARFRTLNPRSDGRLDLDQVRTLVFVLDHATVKPGTKGTIWISDLGTYR
jgi:hypothetical protein